MKANILVVGTDSDHFLRFIKYCDLQYDSDIQIDVFLTSINTSANGFREGNVYGVSIPRVLKLLLRIPYIRDAVIVYFQVEAFRKLLIGKTQYSLISIHQLKTYTLPLTRIAKKVGIKVMLTPWGSDVLRASRIQKKKLKKAFCLADYVSSDHSIGFTEKYVQMYNVSRFKLYDTGYGSEVISSIADQKFHLDKNTVANEFGIPEERYYITCGYAANRAQRHVNMIEAIGENKTIFPNRPFLIFPFTYGPDKMNGYQSELIDKCSHYKLDYCFVTEYLAIDKVARLRLLSDLYFHLLPTDAFSASLIEYILAGSLCIKGKWLDYPSLEKYQVPYYNCDSLSELSTVIYNIFQKNVPKIIITNETEQMILSYTWENVIKKWFHFFRTNIV